MASAERVITKVHRVAGGLLWLATFPAAYASFNGGQPAAFVYLPLPFLFTLMLTGLYQLALPWLRNARARRSARGPSS